MQKLKLQSSNLWSLSRSLCQKQTSKTHWSRSKSPTKTTLPSLSISTMLILEIITKKKLTWIVLIIPMMNSANTSSKSLLSALLDPSQSHKKSSSWNLSLHWRISVWRHTRWTWRNRQSWTSGLVKDQISNATSSGFQHIKPRWTRAKNLCITIN